MTALNKNILLGNYDAVAISISGGKDSQTILDVVMKLAVKQQYGGKILAINADTGAEWHESLPHCRMLCEHYNIPLKAAVPFRSLPDHIERQCKRLKELGKKGGWPSASCKYCTSDCKRNPIHAVTRHEFPALAEGKCNILQVTGERRQESSKRAKLTEFENNKHLTTLKRSVTNWRPILDYTVDDVWACIKATGLPRHIAYDLGNERLSCAICVLASENDINNGAIARPDVTERYLRIERETGHTFRHKRSLAQILKREGK